MLVELDECLMQYEGLPVARGVGQRGACFRARSRGSRLCAREESAGAVTRTAASAVRAVLQDWTALSG